MSPFAHWQWPATGDHTWVVKCHLRFLDIGGRMIRSQACSDQWMFWTCVNIIVSVTFTVTHLKSRKLRKKVNPTRSSQPTKFTPKHQCWLIQEVTKRYRNIISKELQHRLSQSWFHNEKNEKEKMWELQSLFLQCERSTSTSFIYFLNSGLIISHFPKAFW